MSYEIPKHVEELGKDIKESELKYHNKRVTVSKEFTFDSAHHLHKYDGKCKSMHGHTYRVVIGISGKLNDIGMMVDFGDIKKMYEQRIKDKLDHQYLNEVLPNMNTTAENMVVWMFEQLDEALREQKMDEIFEARIAFVRLYETPTSYAEVTWSDMHEG